MSASTTQITEAESLLSEYKARRKRWEKVLSELNAGVLPVGKKAGDLDSVMHFHAPYKAALDDLTNMQMANKTAMRGQARLAGAVGAHRNLNALVAERTSLVTKIKDGKTDISAAADPATRRNNSKMLHRVEEALNQNKPEEALRLLKRAEPGWFARKFRSSDAMALSADLARIRIIVAEHKQATARLKEMKPLLRAAEKSGADSVRSALKGLTGNSRELDAFLANPHVKKEALTNPALAFILDFCHEKKTSIFGRGMSNREIHARMRSASPPITLKDMAEALKDVTTHFAPEIQKARREVPKLEIKYSNMRKFAENCLWRQKYDDGIKGQVKGSVSAEHLLNQIVHNGSLSEKDASVLLDRIKARKTAWLTDIQMDAYDLQAAALVPTGAHASGITRPLDMPKISKIGRAFGEAANEHVFTPTWEGTKRVANGIASGAKSLWTKAFT